MSQTRGVVRRSELTQDPPRADSLDEYKICRAGDVVFNKMSIRDGAMGVAREDGLVTYHYEVMRPRPGTDPRYVVFLMKSDLFLGELIQRERGIGIGGTSGVRTTEVPFTVLRTIDAPIPVASAQRAIADYLEAETARIDALVETRRRSASLARERFESRVWTVVTKGLVSTSSRPSGVAWLGDIPAHWDTPAISHVFEVQLGKMLNPEASSSGEMFPYLRNENVQWDRIDLGDLNQMHFDATDRSRYRLEPGDLLVCEGGEVGRAATWRGELSPCYYQKALHRVRARKGANPRFLMYVLRAAAGRGVFANEGNSSTFVHLTAEKLRAHRFPYPPVDEQNRIVEELNRDATKLSAVESALSRQIALLLERRQAIITTAVTGTLQVPGMVA